MGSPYVESNAERGDLKLLQGPTLVSPIAWNILSPCKATIGISATSGPGCVQIANIRAYDL